MCGRVSISEPTSIAKELHLKLADDLARPGNINVPPTLELPVFTDQKPSELQYLSWTLIPFWAKEKPKFSTFNARIENLKESIPTLPAWINEKALRSYYGWLL